MRERLGHIRDSRSAALWLLTALCVLTAPTLLVVEDLLHHHPQASTCHEHVESVDPFDRTGHEVTCHTCVRVRTQIAADDGIPVALLASVLPQETVTAVQSLGHDDAFLTGPGSRAPPA